MIETPLNKNQLSTWSIIRPFWISDQKLFAISSLCGILVVNLLIVYLSVKINQVNVGLYDALEKKDSVNFLRASFYFGVEVVFFVTAYIINSLWIGFLGFKWREWMTHNYLNQWFQKSAFYHMSQYHGVENPDQRLTDDLSAMSRYVIELTVGVFREMLTMISFLGVLWNLSAGCKLFVAGRYISIPGYLIWIAVLYAALGTLGIVKMGRSLVQLNFQRERYEADFRYALVRVREYREEIALQNGGAFENLSLRTGFSAIAKNFYEILKRNIIVDFIQHSYTKFADIFSMATAAPLYFSGTLSFGELMRVPGAFRSVLGAFSIVVSSFHALALLKATTNRVREFLEKMERAQQLNFDSKFVRQLSDTDNGLSIEDLEIVTPDDRTIVRNLTVDLKPGERVLVMGRSGLGKSSLLKVVGHLWSYGSGTLRLPRGKLLIVPQKPYLPLGTLAAGLWYPSSAPAPSKATYAQAEQLLTAVGLGALVARLEQSIDWSKVLSVGEQQRFQFIRAILNAPQVLLMDEPTSALDVESEALVFETLLRCLPQITLLTIGHSNSLSAFHHRIQMMSAAS